jgi:hypothetical protein
MSYFSRYDKGDWKAICDVCGREFKGSELQKRWDGLMTCEQDWEPRQPQDFVRGVADIQAPSWTRPQQSDQFIPVTYIYDPNGNPIMYTLTSQSSASLTIVVTRH